MNAMAVGFGDIGVGIDVLCYEVVFVGDGGWKFEDSSSVLCGGSCDPAHGSLFPSTVPICVYSLFRHLCLLCRTTPRNSERNYLDIGEEAVKKHWPTADGYISAGYWPRMESPAHRAVLPTLGYLSRRRARRASC